MPTISETCTAADAEMTQMAGVFFQAQSVTTGCQCLLLYEKWKRVCAVVK